MYPNLSKIPLEICNLITTRHLIHPPRHTEIGTVSLLVSIRYIGLVFVALRRNWLSLLSLSLFTSIGYCTTVYNPNPKPDPEL